MERFESRHMKNWVQLSGRRKFQFVSHNAYFGYDRKRAIETGGEFSVFGGRKAKLAVRVQFK